MALFIVHCGDEVGMPKQCVIRCASKVSHQKDMLEKNWIPCSNHDKHYRLNSQHDRGRERG